MEKVLVSSHKRIVVPSPRPLAVREIQLINRVEEMDILRQEVDKSIGGQGGVVFLCGEAGIGKTRLARELGAYARSRGMQVLSGRCPALFRMDGVPPYTLWEEVIKDYLEVCTPEQLYRVVGFYPVEVSKLVPELRQKLRTFPEAFPLSPEHSRDRLFEAVSQFITNISKETPLLVILDDLQWTDQSSLLLLHYLARGIYRESLLLLGAYRDAYIDDQHPLTPVLTELNRERLLLSVPLKRLSSDDVAEMIRRILEDDDVSKDFCQLIYEKTMGNPFFVEEVIKSLKEEEVITRKEKKWEIKEVSRIEFPETVKNVIRNRISRLDDESQRVLTMASFVGKDFTFETLRGVVGVEEEKLLEIMEKMLKTGLIKQSVIHGEDVCSFADVIVRDAVYEEVSPLRRKRLHGVVAQALEKLYAEKVDEHLGELAFQFLESGDKDKALDYFLKAGDKAANIYANSEATSYLQSALKLLEGREGELKEKARVLERLGDIKELVGEYELCIKYWNEALHLRNQLFEKTDVAQLHRKMANTFWEDIGNTQKAKQHYDKALGIFEAKPESVELASLLEGMAHMYYRIGEMAKALSLAEKALELAKKLNAYEVIGSSYESLGTIFLFTGELKRSIECHEKALKIALDNRYMETALRAYNNIAVSLPPQEYERRMEFLEKGHELAKKIGHIGVISWIGAVLAFLYVLMGKMDKAALLAEESVVLARKAGNTPQLSNSIGFRGFAYQVLGEWDKSEQCYKEAASICQGLKDFQTIAANNFFLGWLHFDKGEHAKAIEFFEKMRETYEKAGAKYDQVFFSQFSTWSYIEHGENEKAKSLIDTMEKFALQIDDKGLIVTADALSAALFRAQKKWKESIERFEKALHGFDAIGARQWNIYLLAKMGLYEYARVYLERDQEGDREKAHNLLNQALEIFENIGAKKDMEKVESRLMYAETGRKMAEPKLTAEISEVAPPSHITTGYGDLDDLLLGGIPRNHAVILTSPSCDERDLLIKRYLEAGLKNGEVTFYVTIDPGEAKSLTEEFQSNFYLFVCNPQADKIVKSLPNVFKLKGVENLTDINISLNSAFRKLDKSPKAPRRACIGIISDVLLQHHSVDTRRWLTGLIPELKSRGFTTLATMNPQMHPSEEVHAILGLFEGEINIYKKKTRKDSEKFLKIEKMLNQKYSESELPLRREKLQQ